MSVTPRPPSAGSRKLTLLFTCVGRRIELLQAFRAAAARLNIELRLVAVDRSPTAPGMACADAAHGAPSADSDRYIDFVCDVIAAEGVHALIPTIDHDLPVLAANKPRLRAAGCVPLVCNPDVVRVGRDKIETFHFLKRHGFDTPETWTLDEVLARHTHEFPYFLKPRYGFAAIGARRVADLDELRFHGRRIDEAIVQEFVGGQEYTLDAYVGLGGATRCVVPRARWQVRAGEVIKGVVVKDPQIMSAGTRLTDQLGSGAVGVITLQCIVTPERRIRFIEINTRFGGGAPLAIAAGADFPAWLMLELLGERPDIRPDGFRHGLCMLRYDWSAFVPLDEALTPAVRKPLCPPPDFLKQGE